MYRPKSALLQANRRNLLEIQKNSNTALPQVFCSNKNFNLYKDRLEKHSVLPEFMKKFLPKYLSIAFAVFLLLFCCSCQSIHQKDHTTTHHDSISKTDGIFEPDSKESLELLSLSKSAHPKSGIDLRNSCRSSLEGPDVFDTIWTYAAKGRINKPPSMDEKGNIFFGSADSNFYAITPEGKLFWKTQLQEWIDSTPAIAEDGSIYIGCDDGNLVALSGGGELLWKYYLHAEISSSPAIYNNLILAGSEDGFLYGFDSKGKVRLKFRAQNRILVSSPLITNDGLIVIGAEDHHIYALTLEGELEWKYRTEKEESFVSPPLSDSEGNIFFATPDKKIICLDSKGNLKWETIIHEEVFAPMAVNSNNILIASALDGVLMSFNPDGSLRWKTWMEGSSEGGPMLDSRDRIYICTENHILLYDNQGNRLQKKKIDCGEILTPPVIGKDKKIYFGTQKGKLHCLGEK